MEQVFLYVFYHLGKISCKSCLLAKAQIFLRRLNFFQKSH